LADANNDSTVGTYVSASGSLVTVSAPAGRTLQFYQNAMVFYSTDGSAASGLTNNTTYFVEDFFASATPSQWRISLKALPNSAVIASISGGSGVQTFTRIGVSFDKDIIHIRNSGFTQYDMIEYAYPAGGHFGAPGDQIKDYYFIQTAYDTHNYTIWKEKQDSFNVRMLLVGGGGSGGNALGGGGGGGGVVNVPAIAITPGTLYPVAVGEGGSGQTDRFANNKGGNSTAFGATAAGGGSSGAHNIAPGTSGGCGGGESSIDEVVGSNRGGISTGNSLGTPTGTTHGFGGGSQTTRRTSTACRGAGGGGAGGAAANINVNSYNGSNGQGNNGSGGVGYQSDITGTNLYYAGGGGGGCYVASGFGGAGGLGGGGGGSSNASEGGGSGGGSAQNSGAAGIQGDDRRGGNGGANTGGGGGGGSWSSDNTGGFGGSGVIILRYPGAQTITLGAGLTGVTTTVGSDKVTRITAGSGNISWN
jgi:fibronectin-binding autotransporter adhesin